MDSEIKALKENKTWKVEDLSIGKHPISCKWVYSVKYNSYGPVQCHHVRLVI